MSSETQGKHKRSANFNKREESLLISLAEKNRHILECKLSDVKTNKTKSDCWKKIEDDFNADAGQVYRCKEVLRKKYENMKKSTKKKFADEKCYLRGTGGGPPINTVISDIDEKIKNILGVRIEGNSSEFDGDSRNNMNIPEKLDVELSPIPLNESTHQSLLTNINFDTIISYEDEDEAEAFQDEGNKEMDVSLSHKRKLLNWKPNTDEEVKKRKKNIADITSKVSQWANTKTILEIKKKESLVEEQQLKLQFMREKHEQDIKASKEKSELELKLMQEEHNLKIEILNIQKEKIKLLKK